MSNDLFHSYDYNLFVLTFIKMSWLKCAYIFLKHLAYSHLLKYFILHCIQWYRKQRQSCAVRTDAGMIPRMEGKVSSSCYLSTVTLDFAGALLCCRLHLVWEGCTATCLLQCKMSWKSMTALKTQSVSKDISVPNSSIIPWLNPFNFSIYKPSNFGEGVFFVCLLLFLLDLGGG